MLYSKTLSILTQARTFKKDSLITVLMNGINLNHKSRMLSQVLKRSIDFMNQTHGGCLFSVHDPVATKHLSHDRSQFSCLKKSDRVNLVWVSGARTKTTEYIVYIFNSLQKTDS